VGEAQMIFARFMPLGISVIGWLIGYFYDTDQYSTVLTTDNTERKFDFKSV
jgi:hypothetical protein